MTSDDITQTPGEARLTMRLHMPNGLHARPAARLAQQMQEFSSEVTLGSDFGEADAKSMLDVLSLALQDGSDLDITAKGPDAADAVRAAAAFLAGLGEQ